MLTCLDYVTHAMRELGQLASGEEPTAEEAEDGLNRLQAILDGLFGNGIGASLIDQEIDDSADLVADTRALVFATSAMTLTFPESPFNGARIQVKDMSGNFATYAVTLDGNNRLINGASTATLNVNGTDKTYVYVADTANWALVSPLGLSDTLPLGDDEFFVLYLAKRLAPMFGAQFAQESEIALLRAANRIRARFATRVIVPCDDAVLFLSRQSYNTGFTGL